MLPFSCHRTLRLMPHLSFKLEFKLINCCVMLAWYSAHDYIGKGKRQSIWNNFQFCLKKQSFIVERPEYHALTSKLCICTWIWRWSGHKPVNCCFKSCAGVLLAVSYHGYRHVPSTLCAHPCHGEAEENVKDATAFIRLVSKVAIKLQIPAVIAGDWNVPYKKLKKTDLPCKLKVCMWAIIVGASQ